MFSACFCSILLSGVLIQPLLAVKTCYFCADYAYECKINDRAMFPQKMNCMNWRVNEDDAAKEHIHQPLWLKRKDDSDIYAARLPEKNVKTSCIAIRYKNIPNEVNDTAEYLIFKSCIYRHLVSYDDACAYFRAKVFHTGNANDYKCIICHKQDCNSGKMPSLSRVISMGVVFFAFHPVLSL